jgi:hypothetical protein
MAANLLFYYFGDDEAYYKALQGEFKKHAKILIDFKRVYEKSESKIQTLLTKVFSDKPACVFIDFSKETQDYLHLARLISRTPFEHEILTVGLVDYLSPPEVLRESIATGVKLNFIKSAETFDVAFSVTKLIAPQSIGEHGFANASLKEDYEVGILCKVGYVNNESLHIETDHQLSKGDRVVLNHFWLDKRIVPSKHIFVKEVSTSNMFYQFKYNADMDFLFIDDFLPPEGMPDDQIKLKNNERDDLIIHHKKQLKHWIEENKSDSLEKKAKVLVVDYGFHFYHDQPRTDKYAYTIRCIPFFNDIVLELDRLRPQIIAYQIDKGENIKNSMDGLRKLVTVLATNFSDLKPYLIIFNTDDSSLDLQASLSYPQTLTHKENLSPELLIKLADVLQKKITKTTGTEKNVLPKVFIKKNHASSTAEMLKSVTVTKLSETDMILQSDTILATGTNLHFTKPVEMFVNIQPVAKPSGKTPEYYGVIHSIGETDKKELRRYVNGIFFRDHDAKLTAENEEVAKLKELKQQEKIAKEEAAEKAAAETGTVEKVSEPEVK